MKTVIIVIFFVSKATTVTARMPLRRGKPAVVCTQSNQRVEPVLGFLL